MKKIYILSLFLATCCYLQLSASYTYGASVPCKKEDTLPPIDSIMASVASSMPALMSLCQLIQQGNIHYDQKNYPTAIAIYKDALAKYYQNYREESILLTMIYHKLGESYLALKAYTQSLFFLQHAHRIRQTCLCLVFSGDNEVIRKSISDIMGESHYSLGRLYFVMHDLDTASQSFNMALTTEWQHRVEAIEAAHYLAKVYQLQKKYKLSEAYYNDVLAKQAKTHYLNPNTIATIEKNLSEVTKKIKEMELLNPSNRSTMEEFNTTLFPTPPTNNQPLSYSLPRPEAQNQMPRAAQKTGDTDKKAFSCSVCHKKFSRKQNLRVHMRVHTGEKPFACFICKQKFAQKQHVKAHLRTHTGEKPFSCAICHKKFSLKQNMIKHQITHTGERPFGCPVCYKRFSVKNNMKKHLRIHTGEKPFSCYLCGKKFTQKNNMKKHLRTHTGEKLFSCPLYDKKFKKTPT